MRDQDVTALDDADKLRTLARWLDLYDARRDADDTSDEVQQDLRRIAMNIETGVYGN